MRKFPGQNWTGLWKDDARDFRDFPCYGNRGPLHSMSDSVIACYILASDALDPSCAVAHLEGFQQWSLVTSIAPFGGPAHGDQDGQVQNPFGWLAGPARGAHSPCGAS